MAKGSLVVKPTKCPKCGDDGDGPILYVGEDGYKSHCHCRTDPKSLWYFNNVVMSENIDTTKCPCCEKGLYWSWIGRGTGGIEHGHLKCICGYAQPFETIDKSIL